MIEPLSLPYQYDVTAITPVINTIIEKILEVAKEHFVKLPSEVRLYTRIDIATITEVLGKVAAWEKLLVSQIGLETDLVPKFYDHVDYNSIISLTDYYATNANAIIVAAQSTQEPPSHRWK